MNPKKIKFITGYNSLYVENYYLSLTPNGKGLVNDFQFFFNEPVVNYNHDYVVVFEQMHEAILVSIPLDRVIFVAGEATAIKSYNQKFLDQFGHVITSQAELTHKSKHLRSPGHTWFSKKTYDELLGTTTVTKTKLLSIVVSNKKFTKGHRDRLAFCLKLKERLGDKVDLFGRGFNQIDDKWEAIAPYKYSIAIENTVEAHWVTEKIGDCYTSHTFPFYFGAPNIDDYYNPNSYVLIDINDFEKSFDTIMNIINDSDHYSNHLEFLKEAKFEFINKHSIIPMVCNFINDRVDLTNKHSKHEVRTIYPEKKIDLRQKLKIFTLLDKWRKYLLSFI